MPPGREMREISGSALASVNQGWHPVGVLGSARAAGCRRCRALDAVRVARRPRDKRWWRAQAGRQGGPGGTQAQSPFGAGCGGPGAAGGRGGFGAGGGNPGPYVLAGTYNVSLLVDGKTLETKPLKVMADPEVVLTEAERKKLFDMAMEMHELQRRATEVAAGIGPLNTRLAELSKEAASKSDLPADLKASVDDAAEGRRRRSRRSWRCRCSGGRGGGRGGGGGADSLVARLAPGQERR